MTSPPLLRNYTVPEVADTLRTSPVNVYKLIRKGELVAVRFGSRVIVTDEDLRNFINAHRTGATG